jgi:hypothetical protein
MFDASVLIGKVAVLSQEKAKEYTYALYDKDVYISSREWEEMYEDSGDMDTQEEEACLLPQLSQDY